MGPVRLFKNLYHTDVLLSTPNKGRYFIKALYYVKNYGEGCQSSVECKVFKAPEISSYEAMEESTKLDLKPLKKLKFNVWP